MIAIAAMSENRAIGLNGKLPWPSVKEDFQHFKRMTLDKNIIVGRKTFDELPHLKRRNIFVLTRTKTREEIFVGLNLGQIVNRAENLPEDGIICGGAEIYSLLLPSCTELYLTLIKGNFKGDTFMPAFEHLFNKTETVENGQNYEIKRYFRG